MEPKPPTELGDNWTVFVLQIKNDPQSFFYILMRIFNIEGLELPHYTIRHHTAKYIYVSLRFFQLSIKSYADIQNITQDPAISHWVVNPWDYAVMITNDPELLQLPERERSWAYYNMWIPKGGSDPRRDYHNCWILHQLSKIALLSVRGDVVETAHLLTNMLGLTEHVKCKVANSVERNLFRPILGVSYTDLNNKESGVYYHENYRNEREIGNWLTLMIEFMEKHNKKSD